MIAFKKDINDDDLPLTWRYYRNDGKILMVENKNKQSVKLLVIVDHNEYYLGIIDHIINSDGIVNPSVVCPVKDCNFHDMIRLEDLSDL